MKRVSLGLLPQLTASYYYTRVFLHYRREWGDFVGMVEEVCRLLVLVQLLYGSNTFSSSPYSLRLPAARFVQLPDLRSGFGCVG